MIQASRATHMARQFTPSFAGRNDDINWLKQRALKMLAGAPRNTCCCMYTNALAYYSLASAPLKRAYRALVIRRNIAFVVVLGQAWQ